MNTHQGVISRYYPHTYFVIRINVLISNFVAYVFRRSITYFEAYFLYTSRMHMDVIYMDASDA